MRVLLALVALVFTGHALAVTKAQALQGCWNYSGGLPGGTAGSQAQCVEHGPALFGAALKPYFQLTWKDPRQTPPTDHPNDADKRFAWDDPQYCASHPGVKGEGPAGGSNTCHDGCVYKRAAGISVSIGGESTSFGDWTPTGDMCAGGYAIASTAARICGGSSCFDPTSGNYCALDSSGAEVCVKGPSGGGDPGGCSSSSSATVCAGSPSAPSPPAPPESPISDPATEATGSDGFSESHSSASGSVTNNTTIVNTYGQGGASNAPTSSGQGSKPDDKGPDPAPSGSTGKPGSYAGGADCNSPPVCSGDAVLCGIGRQEWRTMCANQKGFTDLKDAVDQFMAGEPPPEGDGAPTLGDVWQDGAAGGSGTGDPLADAANAGSYDFTGLGFATTCPLHDMTIDMPGGRSFVIKFSDGCDLGGWLRAIIIAFAVFAAAKITTGGIK